MRWASSGGQMEEKIISVKDNLLNSNVTLKHVGYSKKPMLKYNREAIKKKNRIKEWDYYYIADDRFALCLTISDLSYATVISASVIEFGTGNQFNNTSVAMFPRKRKKAVAPSKPSASVRIV